MTGTAIASWYANHVRAVMARYGSDLAVYRRALHERVLPGDRLLHLGCGWDRSQVAGTLLDRCEVVGVDVERAAGERYPAPFWRADAARLPFTDAAFDLVCAEYVMEHLADPDACFAEVRRVLRLGGAFVFLTPNRWSYKAAVAALTPHRFHRVAARRLRPDARAADDVFPTLYRANSRRAIGRLAARHGFRVEAVEMLDNGPTWFRHLPGLFELGHVYHRAIGRAGLEGLRCAMLACLRREGEGPRREALAIRCTRCGADGMTRSDDAYRCGACGRLYSRAGHRVETLS